MDLSAEVDLRGDEHRRARVCRSRDQLEASSPDGLDPVFTKRVGAGKMTGYAICRKCRHFTNRLEEGML